MTDPRHPPQAEGATTPVILLRCDGCRMFAFHGIGWWLGEAHHCERNGHFRLAPIPPAPACDCGHSVALHRPGKDGRVVCYGIASDGKGEFCCDCPPASLASSAPTGETTRGDDEDASIRLTVRGLRSLTEHFGRIVAARRGGVIIAPDMAYAIQIELQDKLRAASLAPSAAGEGATCACGQPHIAGPDGEDEGSRDGRCRRFAASSTAGGYTEPTTFIGWLGSGYNSRGAFPTNLSELSADMDEWARASSTATGGETFDAS